MGRTEIATLGGKTPLEAVNDPDGRELIESLLVDFERNAEKTGPGGTRPQHIAEARKLLNL